MNIVRTTKKIESVTLEQFADKHGLVMEISENDCDHSSYKYIAFFRNVLVWDKYTDQEYSTTGQGKSEAEAMLDYARKISEKKIIHKSFSPCSRKTIKVPELCLHSVR